MQISAASASPNFQGRIILRKIAVLFLAICAKFPCKIERSELEVVSVGIFGAGFCFQGSH